MAFLMTIVLCRRWRVAPRRWIAPLFGLVLACVVASGASAQATTSAEYQVKAVFLFNFAQFVEWPAHAFRDANGPLVIGILGEDPFGAYLDELVRDEKVGNRPLVVRRFKGVEGITECHLLFISRSEAGGLDRIIAGLKGRSILTVSDIATFTRQGGLVRFVTENGKIRLRINVDAAKASHLTISSKILRPATIVAAGKD